MYKKYLVITYIVLCSLLILIFLRNNYEATETHEDVHRQIDLYFGCKNISVEVTWFKGGSTTCHDENQTFYPEQQTMHSFNEVISYNNDLLVGAINIGVFFIITMMFIIAYIFLFKWEEPKLPIPPIQK